MHNILQNVHVHAQFVVCCAYSQTFVTFIILVCFSFPIILSLFNCIFHVKIAYVYPALFSFSQICLTWISVALYWWKSSDLQLKVKQNVSLPSLITHGKSLTLNTMSKFNIIYHHHHLVGFSQPNTQPLHSHDPPSVSPGPWYCCTSVLHDNINECPLWSSSSPSSMLWIPEYQRLCAKLRVADAVTGKLTVLSRDEADSRTAPGLSLILALPLSVESFLEYPGVGAINRLLLRLGHYPYSKIDSAVAVKNEHFRHLFMLNSAHAVFISWEVYQSFILIHMLLRFSKLSTFRSCLWHHFKNIHSLYKLYDDH